MPHRSLQAWRSLHGQSAASHLFAPTDPALKAHLTERLLSSDGDTAWNDRNGRKEARAKLADAAVVGLMPTFANL